MANQKLYSVLELSPDASESDIKRAFRKLAMLHHPDKGGSEAKFKEIQHAYEVLSSPERRRVYDQTGEDMDLHQLQQRPQCADSIHVIEVDLETMYSGATQEFHYTKQVICSGCQGQGTKSGAVIQVCRPCKGRGRQTQVRPLGPGMMQQVFTMCPECHGEGKIIEAKDRCEQCRGAKTVSTQATVSVVIEPGARSGSKIRFHGLGDQEVGVRSGDLVCLVREKPHPIFTRDGPNLVRKQKITLLDALTGCRFRLKHLNGRMMELATPTDKVVKPNEIWGIDHEGMPLWRQSRKGALLIQFEIIFPDSISPHNALLLASLLPSSPAVTGSADASMTLRPGIHPVHEAPPVDEEQEEAERLRHAFGGAVPSQCPTQ
jgi:DnaJ homolog subfamily A member 2